MSGTGAALHVEGVGGRGAAGIEGKRVVHREVIVDNDVVGRSVGRELVVSNMDWPVPGCINQTYNEPCTLSVIRLDR